MQACPRRAISASRVDFPAPEQPEITMRTGLTALVSILA
jgi:hypothetical protein